VTDFPAGAKTFTVTLWATLWSEKGEAMGSVWYDDVSVTEVATGRELIQGGDFEATVRPEDLKPTFDFTAWDAAVQHAFDTYHFNTLDIPIAGMGGGTFEGRDEPSLLGYPEGTPAYEAAFDAYCKGMDEHLRAKGWLDKAYVYWFDEPDVKDFPFVAAGMERLKKHFPGIRRLITKQPEVALQPANLWCPLTPAYDEPKWAARRAAGDMFWWYICTGPKEPYCTEFIDHPGTELRVWLWQTWQAHVRGVLIWETSYWTSNSAYPKEPQNPYEDPMSWVTDGHLGPGTRQPWGNGDGRFLYPPEAAADAHPKEPVLDGPVDSQRLELLREGLEDYEYFVILRRLLNELGPQLGAAERAADEALLTVPPDISADMTHFTRDPAPIEARRLAIARAIERLTSARTRL
jgi:hypothetical protein